MRYLLVCLIACAVLSSSFRFALGQDSAGDVKQIRLSAKELALRIESKSKLLEGLPRHHRWRDKFELEIERDRAILDRLELGRSSLSTDQKFKISPSRERDSDVPSALSANDSPPMPFELKEADLGKPVSIEGTQIDNNQDEYQILRKNGDGKFIRVPRSNVEGIKESDISSMPSGLLDRFSASDAADLLAFLKSPNP
jgi:hypothetical protein